MTISEALTVIVTTFERHRCAERFLNSVTTHFPDLKVLVSDASAKSPYPHLHQWNENVTWHHLPKERGHTVGAGRNYLLEQVTSDFFFLADDDHIFTDGTDLNRMYEFLIRNDYDIVGGSQGRGDYGTAIFELKNKTLYQHFNRFHERLEHQVVSCDRVSNTFLARTGAVQKVKWEERVFAAEHAEFFWRASQAGLKIAQMGGVWVEHNRSCEEARGLSVLGGITGHRDRRYHAKMVGAKNPFGLPSHEAKTAYQKYCLEKNGLERVVDKKGLLEKPRLRAIMEESHC